MNELKEYHFYKIIDSTTNQPIYIGCTSQQLNRRFWQHNHDIKSAVYNNYVLKENKNLSIKEISLTINKQFNYSICLKYEELLTYIYGYSYKLCNHNAGNLFYQDLNDSILYQKIHDFLFHLIEKEISICDISDYNEIISCIQKICSTNETDLNQLDDIICERICELEDGF